MFFYNAFRAFRMFDFELLTDMYYAAPELWYAIAGIFGLLLALLVWELFKILKLRQRNYFLNRDRERYAETLYASRDGYFAFIYPDQKINDPRKHIVEHCSRRLAVMMNLPNGTKSVFDDLLKNFYKDDVKKIQKYTALLRDEGVSFEDEFSLKQPGKILRLSGARINGSDGNIYFSDMNGPNWYICSVNATAGSMMNQLTNGNVKDSDPMLSADGKRLFFTRIAGSGPSIWSLNRENGTLTSCSRGYSVCLIPDDPDAFYCVRNSTTGRSEIWYVNFVKGQESLIASDENRSFTNPRLSPDGKWLVCVGNSISNVTKKPNLDIFVVRTDGSRLTQLTFHPQTDTSPVWSADGRSIYFISSRANEDQAYNVWRMNFNLE